MKLKPKKIEVRQEEPKKKTKKVIDFYSDEYKPIFPPMRILVREVEEKNLKQYLEISVKRFDDDYAKPFVWISMYQESDFFTGYLKGKTIYLPLNCLYDLIETLDEVGEVSDKLELFKEFDP